MSFTPGGSSSLAWCKPSVHWPPKKSTVTMQAWKAEESLQELQGFAELSRKRPDSKMLDTVWQCLEQRMKSQGQLSPTCFLKLMDGVESMDMGPEFKSKVLTSLDTMGSGSASATKLVTVPQTIPYISAYSTNKDWNSLQEASMVSDALQVQAEGNGGEVPQRGHQEASLCFAFVVDVSERDATTFCHYSSPWALG